MVFFFVFFSPIKRIVKWKYRNENYDPSHQSMAGDWCVSFRQVSQVSKMNFPSEFTGSLGPALHCVGQATAGMPKGPNAEGSSDLSVAKLHRLAAWPANLRAALQLHSFLPVNWLQTTPKDGLRSLI